MCRHWLACLSWLNHHSNKNLSILCWDCAAKDWTKKVRLQKKLNSKEKVKAKKKKNQNKKNYNSKTSSWKECVLLCMIFVATYYKVAICFCIIDLHWQAIRHSRSLKRKLSVAFYFSKKTYIHWALMLHKFFFYIVFFGTLVIYHYYSIYWSFLLNYIWFFVGIGSQ